MEVPYERDKSRIRTKLDFKNIRDGVSSSSAKVVPPKEAHVDLQNSYQLNMRGFIDRFKGINSMNDQELMQFVRITYLDALEVTSIKDSKPDQDTLNELINVFTNPRFLLAMKQIINAYPLDFPHSIYLNHLVYQYLMLRPLDQRDPIVSDLYMQMAQMTNIRLITTLASCNLDRGLCTSIAIAAGSSFDDMTRVRRVNKVVIASNVNYSYANIVDIYQHTFGQMVTKMFISTMFQIFDTNQMTEQQVEINGLIELAILYIINSMPLESIRLVLTSYANYCVSNPRYVRFSMNTLSSDYARIRDVIIKLNEEGILMP